MQKTRYYESVKVAGGFKGRIYGYKENGNTTVVWLSPDTYPTAEDATDAACEWADEHNMEVELG